MSPNGRQSLSHWDKICLPLGGILYPIGIKKGKTMPILSLEQIDELVEMTARELGTWAGP